MAFLQSNTAPAKVTRAAAARWPDRARREVALRSELVRESFQLVDKIPDRRSPTLTVAEYGDWFSVRFATDGVVWRPEYVNICLPFRRTTVGFDTDDLCLDLVLDQQGDDLDIRWKDDPDLDVRASLGIYTPQQVVRIRSEAHTAVQRIRTGAAPFDDTWTHWKPDLEWEQPDHLPDTWRYDLEPLAFGP